LKFESTSTGSGSPVVFLPDVSSVLLRPESEFLRVLVFLCVLCVQAFDIVFRPQNLNTEHTEKCENTERELVSQWKTDRLKPVLLESDGQRGLFGEKIANRITITEGNSNAVRH